MKIKQESNQKPPRSQQEEHSSDTAEISQFSHYSGEADDEETMNVYSFVPTVTIHM